MKDKKKLSKTELEEQRKKFIADAKKLKKQNQTEHELKVNSGVTEVNGDNWRNILNENPQKFLNQLESIKSQITTEPGLLFDSVNNSIFINYAIALVQSFKEKEEEKTKILLDNYNKFLEVMVDYVRIINIVIEIN